MLRKFPSKGTIGFLAIHLMESGASYEATTKKVLKTFPTSKWNKAHWAWYRHQLKVGNYVVPAVEVPKPKSRKAPKQIPVVDDSNDGIDGNPAVEVGSLAATS